MNQLKMKTLNDRLKTQYAELQTCKTKAEIRCVKQAMADTERQINEANAE